jgi:hypothetical protein
MMDAEVHSNLRQEVQEPEGVQEPEVVQEPEGAQESEEAQEPTGVQQKWEGAEAEELGELMLLSVSRVLVVEVASRVVQLAEVP